jgi:IclR family acetate operon transcriptional repressor
MSVGLSIVEALAVAPDGLTVSELARELRVHKGVVSRTLRHLMARGYVVASPATRRFSLALSILALGLRYADRLGFPGVCLPILQDLADESGELVQLGVVDGERLLFVAKAEGRDQRIRMVSMLGQFAPLHATAAGKVFLASLPEEQALDLARRQGLCAFTRRTVTSVAALRRELRRVRRAGYAVVEEELFEGAGAVAAPVRPARLDGRVMGTVSLSGPTFRLPAARKHELAPRVVEAARRLAEIWPLQARLPAAAVALEQAP